MQVDPAALPVSCFDMTDAVKIAPELQARVDAVAVRSHRSPAEVVADALEHGHSLEWQERFLNKVEAGIAQADRGEFATPEEVERVFNKYRPA